MTTGHFLAEAEDVGDVVCTCDGCDWTGSAEHVADIGECCLTPGDVIPVGRCPECDSLCYVKHRICGDSQAALLLLAEAEVIRDRLLDSEEHAVEDAVPGVANDAHDLIGRMSALVQRLLMDGVV